jgi:hypothetical protein
VAAWVQLQSLAVGEVAAVPFQVTAKDATGITLAPVTRNPTTGGLVQNGSVVVAVAGTVTGAWSTDPRVQPVLQQVRQLQAGDLLLGADGQVTMARAVGLGPDQTLWSPYADGRSPQPQTGFQVCGHATPPA